MAAKAIMNKFKSYLPSKKRPLPPVTPDSEKDEENNPRVWAKIAYYETMNKLVDGYRVRTAPGQFLYINCRIQPSTIREFCLGSVSALSRHETIDKVRNAIGNDGIMLWKATHTGNVYLLCLMEGPVFVQSRLMNFLKKEENPNAVMRVGDSKMVQIFNRDGFRRMMTAPYEWKKDTPEPYERLYQMKEMAVVRVGFCKGFGKRTDGFEYSLVDITSTPCWIEIHMWEPLKYLDEQLAKLGGPMSAISSTS